jgi:GT2 family glycosyltransferase
VNSATTLRIAIAIATAGRRDVLTETVRFMVHQRRIPDEFLICPAKPEDADEAALRQLVPHVRVVRSPVGSSHQRNAMIDASNADLMVFFDDDYLPAPDFLVETERLFVAYPDVVVATGNVLADGANGAGLDFGEGFEVLASAGPNDEPYDPEAIYNGYGCNMAVRLAPVRQFGPRFDENLPLYAWLEDVDFSRQLAPHGRVVKSLRMRGVHLGTKKAGRSSGRRLGYSQIANRVYILRKGNMTLKGALEGSFANLTSNFFRSAWPEPWTDRRGRLVGNVMALWDLLRGRLHPANILKM